MYCLEGAIILLRLACHVCLQEKFPYGKSEPDRFCNVLPGWESPDVLKFSGLLAALLGCWVLVCSAMPSARRFLFRVQILISFFLYFSNLCWF